MLFKLSSCHEKAPSSTSIHRQADVPCVAVLPTETKQTYTYHPAVVRADRPPAWQQYIQQLSPALPARLPYEGRAYACITAATLSVCFILLSSEKLF